MEVDLSKLGYPTQLFDKMEDASPEMLKALIKIAYYFEYNVRADDPINTEFTEIHKAIESATGLDWEHVKEIKGLIV